MGLLKSLGRAVSSEEGDERQLVQAARRQDRAAFDALVQAHQARLRAFLSRRVGPDAAEDVLQETFVAAWQALPRLDLRVRFKTWLFSIAVHKIADFHRVQGRRTEQEVPLLEDARYPDAASGPGRGFAAETERREIVRALLNQLNEDQRQLLEMYYFAELTLPEIAVVLQRNLNTVKYQFYRVHAVAAQRYAALGLGGELVLERTPVTGVTARTTERIVFEG